MNSNNAKGYLPLVQALADGRVVQGKFLDGWRDLNVVSFDMDACCYRIKPEPREVWFNRYPDGSEYGPFDTEIEAIDDCDESQGSVQVRYREVVE